MHKRVVDEIYCQKHFSESGKIINMLSDLKLINFFTKIFPVSRSDRTFVSQSWEITIDDLLID
jgi:hypothetical protein